MNKNKVRFEGLIHRKVRRTAEHFASESYWKGRRCTITRLLQGNKTTEDITPSWNWGEGVWDTQPPKINQSPSRVVIISPSLMSSSFEIKDIRSKELITIRLQRIRNSNESEIKVRRGNENGDIIIWV